MHFYVCFSRTIMTNGLPFNAEGDWYVSLVILNSFFCFFSSELFGKKFIRCNTILLNFSLRHFLGSHIQQQRVTGGVMKSIQGNDDRTSDESIHGFTVYLRTSSFHKMANILYWTRHTFVTMVYPHNNSKKKSSHDFRFRQDDS